MNYFCYQTSKDGCGNSCIRMLLATLNKNKTFLYIKNINNQKMSIYEIMNILKKYNVTTESYKNVKIEDVKDNKQPFIAILKKYNVRHCVIVKKITNKTITIYDPSDGIVKMSLNDFCDLWENITIEIITFTKYNINIKKKSITSFTSKITYFCIISFNMLIVYFGLFFIKGNNIVFPLCVIISFGLFQIIDKLYLTNSVNKFDKKFGDILLDSSGNFADELSKYNDFKKQYFLRFKTFISSILSLIFIIFIISFNDFALMLCCIVFFFLYLIETLVFKKYFSYLRSKIEKIETNLTNSQNRKPLFLLLNQTTSKYMYILSILKVINLFFVVVCCVLVMYINNTFSANYIVLTFFMFLFYCEQIETIFNCITSNETYEKAKQNFIIKYLY